MLERIKTLGTKLELLVHTVIDWMVAHVVRLNTPGAIATAAIAIALAIDLVTVGHFGVIKFVLEVGKDVLEFVAKTATSGGWVFVVVMLVGYLAMKELKSK